jgi:lysophospholipase L1-like esterase
MHQILVYGDSLTWGIVPDTRKRWSFGTRWPGVMERALIESGRDVRVIEDCLNGRRTVDGVHLDADQHEQLGMAIAEVAGVMLEVSAPADAGVPGR